MTEARRRILALLALGLLLASGLLPYGRGAEPSPAPDAAAPFFPTAAQAILARVYANAARDDEFVEIANAGSGDLDLSGWSLTDREAIATFPPGAAMPAGARIVVARNSTSYAEDTEDVADFTWDRGDAPRLLGGVLRLADAGDEVLLAAANASIVDAYVYGSSTYAGPGWTGVPADALGRGQVAVRAAAETGWIDTDTAADWTGPRVHRLGQSDLHPPPVDLASPAVAVLSPDDGVAPVLAFLASARRSVDVAVYTFTSEPIASMLADRARAGVRVRVLLEGSPVGGVEDDERRLVAGLLTAGAEVRWMQGASDVVKRYRYLHAKYVVVDGIAALVSSENFGDSGFPPSGGWGNRGWSLLVADLALAGQLWEVFEEDFDPARRDSIAAEATWPVDLPPAASVLPWSPPAAVAAVRARLVAGPDNALDADRILGLLESAAATIDIEAFYVEDPWPTGPNPLLAAAFDAARRGVAVRILLDNSPWSDSEPDGGNLQAADSINARARAEGLDVEARLIVSVAGVDRVHNKGALVDGRAVLVSSLNWAYISATQDREIGLVLDDPAAAARFADAFAADWDGRSSRASAEPGTLGPAATLTAYGVVLAASGLSLLKLRRGAKGTSGRGRMERRGPPRPPVRRGRGEVRLLPAELVAESGPRARGRRGDRGGRAPPRGRGEGPQGDRGPGGDRPRGGGRRHVLRDRRVDRRDRRRDVPPRLPD